MLFILNIERNLTLNCATPLTLVGFHNLVLGLQYISIIIRWKFSFFLIGTRATTKPTNMHDSANEHNRLAELAANMTLLMCSFDLL